MAIVIEKLEKTYKVKKGADVRALKDISFNLPGTGMVFILGKSGCGKSTLLNILGGLDGFDGGDIVIDGKSIKDYKPRDLDGYRNDYVGFVFQENNLLDKESVRRNVGLALDLQSARDTEGKVDGALESVGLKELAEKKCNCLSGGQKQRVAIARALIKQPKLLLCDEPTGALDSETGADIFTLLKELSSERLVVVVSHDRESAEKYGDRVIELKDGEIISDSSPQNTGAPDGETGEGKFNLLKELGKEGLVIVVSRDRESAENYGDRVVEFKDGGRVIKLKDGDRVVEFKDGEIITDSAPLSDTAKVPAPASETKKAAKHGGLRFIRAFTMGVGYIIARPVRLAICLLLCLITFTSVGVADTVYAYDRDNALLYTMEELGSKCYVFGKAFWLSNGSYILNEQGISRSQAEELSSLLDVERCDYIYDMGLMSGWLNDLVDLSTENIHTVYARTKGFVEADAKFLADYGFTLLAGRLPENTGEVAIPGFLFNHYKACGYNNGDGKIDINSYDDLIGKNITFGFITQTLTVTGIVDTHFVYKKQAKVLFDGVPLKDEKAEKEFRTAMEGIAMDAVHNTIFVCNGYADYFFENFGDHTYESSAVLRVIAPYKGSDKQKLKNIRVYTTQYGGKPVTPLYGGECYHLVNYCATSIEEAERTFSIIQEYAVYAVAALAVISALFFMYYASGTIDEKRREIGILRALGASRFDILKIIGSEHGAFTAAVVAISSAIGAVIIAVMNNAFTKAYGLGTTLIKFGIRQFAIVAAVAILAVVVGVALPLIKLLIKKPVDVIADRK